MPKGAKPIICRMTDPLAPLLHGAGAPALPHTADLAPPAPTALSGPQPGRYRHYKGLLYDVLATVRHSETLEPMTLYRALYGEQGLWVRPAAMFEESVVIEGVRQARFALLPPDAPDAPVPA